MLPPLPYTGSIGTFEFHLINAEPRARGPLRELTLRFVEPVARLLHRMSRGITRSDYEAMPRSHRFQLDSLTYIATSYYECWESRGPNARERALLLNLHANIPTANYPITMRDRISTWQPSEYGALGPALRTNHTIFLWLSWLMHLWDYPGFDRGVLVTAIHRAHAEVNFQPLRAYNISTTTSLSELRRYRAALQLFPAHPQDPRPYVHHFPNPPAIREIPALTWPPPQLPPLPRPVPAQPRRTRPAAQPTPQWVSAAPSQRAQRAFGITNVASS